MSGVLAYCASSRGDSLAVARRMGALLCHRPFHGLELASPEGGVALGRHHIGLQPGDEQPLRSRSGDLSVCLTGEFYIDSRERAALARALGLRPEAADAALACELLDQQGIAGITALDGAYTLVVWNAREGELLAVNDRYGLYPHFFARVDGTLALAPEMKAVLAAPGVPCAVDPVAIAQYIRFQQLLGERTWFEDVQLLPPAAVLRFKPSSDRLSMNRHWDWDRIEDRPGVTLGEAVEECDRLFKRAVDLRITPGLRTGVYLSGGLDSRLILAYLDRDVPVTTLTYGAPGCRDVVLAARVAQLAGTTHYWHPFVDGRWVLDHVDDHLALTEGQQSFVHAHGMSTLSLARETFDVNLSGWRHAGLLKTLPETETSLTALDEPVNEADLVRRTFDGLCRLYTWPGLTEPEAASLLYCVRPDLRQAAFDSLCEELGRTSHYPPDRRAYYFRLLQHERRLTGNLVVFTRAAVEVRSPFYDDRLLEFFWSLPLEVRLDRELRRAMMTRRMPRLARVPYDRDGRLPHASRLLRTIHTASGRVVRRAARQLGLERFERPTLYADYEQYLRTDLREWAEQILLGSRTMARGLFDPETVRALWLRHLSGHELWTIGKVAPLITLELTLRAFLDGDLSSPWSHRESSLSSALT